MDSKFVTEEKAFNITYYYGGTYTDEEGEGFEYTVISADNSTDVTWCDKTPKGAPAIALDIIKEFMTR